MTDPADRSDRQVRPHVTEPGGRLFRTTAVLFLAALALRLLHLSSAVDSPFSYHLGADEDYYLQFGQWVAGISTADGHQFAFMDPAYGYLLGLVFMVTGSNPFAALFLQTVVDALTVTGICLVGHALGRMRGGIYGAMLYALTAMFFAQLFGVELGMPQYVAIVLTSVLGAIGTAGVPGPALLSVAVLAAAGIPLAGLPLIFGVDRLFDMMRTSTNVLGDASCAVIVNRMLSEEKAPAGSQESVAVET